MFTVIKKDGTAFWIGVYCDGVIEFNSTLYRAEQAPLDTLEAFYEELIMQINVDKNRAIKENGELTWQEIGLN